VAANGHGVAEIRLEPASANPSRSMSRTWRWSPTQWIPRSASASTRRSWS